MFVIYPPEYLFDMPHSSKPNLRGRETEMHVAFALELYKPNVGDERARKKVTFLEVVEIVTTIFQCVNV